VLWSKSSNGKCATLHTVTSSNDRNHSIIACSRHMYLCVALCAHPICGESHFQRNINWEIATTSAPFCSERTYRTFFLWMLYLAPPSHPVQSTTLLWLETGKPRWQVCKASHLQQATIEIPRRAHSISACLRPLYMGVVLHVPPVRGESHTEHNTNHLQRNWARILKLLRVKGTRKMQTEKA